MVLESIYFLIFKYLKIILNPKIQIINVVKYVDLSL